ncbi:MAG: FeoB-associated Cys-rich membrane protein [Solobacterium sp.]|nr:FeoB-associated Cys-rich membrane protein [Solobacterium sp.]MBR0214168.1 FeoB-associated Cys-rich membrane protein [Solobacterium sp.]
MANIVIILLLIALLYACIRSLWNDHKKGCSGCGRNCSTCSIACGIETIRRQQRAARKGA